VCVCVCLCVRWDSQWCCTEEEGHTSKGWFGILSAKDQAFKVPFVLDNAPRVSRGSQSHLSECPCCISIQHHNLTTTTTGPGNHGNIQKHLPQYAECRWGYRSQCYWMLEIIQHSRQHSNIRKFINKSKSMALYEYRKRVWPEAVNDT